MISLAQQSAATRDRAEHRSAVRVAAYATRRRWSRTDTARWLTERGEPVMARLRFLGRECPGHSKQVGFWLKEVAHDRTIFDRAHAALAALASDTDRTHALVLEVLR